MIIIIIFRNKKKKIILRKNHITQGQRRWLKKCAAEKSVFIYKKNRESVCFIMIFLIVQCEVISFVPLY